jgi:hypothetical protein
MVTDAELLVLETAEMVSRNVMADTPFNSKRRRRKTPPRFRRAMLKQGRGI